MKKYGVSNIMCLNKKIRKTPILIDISQIVQKNPKHNIAKFICSNMLAVKEISFSV